MAVDYNLNNGSINMPKLLRHLSHRTNQVRHLVFERDAIHRKSTKATGATTDTLGTGTALSGPAVNFGYEQEGFADQTESGDNAYHVNSPIITLGGVMGLQSPIVSRSTRHERTGQRVTGECKFYLPTMAQIKNASSTYSYKINGLSTEMLDSTFDTPIENAWKYVQYPAEFETFDKLIDIEQIVDTPSPYLNYNEDNDNYTTTSTLHTINFGDDGNSAFKLGYEIDRLQFALREATNTLTVSGKTIRVSGGININYIEIFGEMDDSPATLRWTPDSSLSLGSSSINYQIFDLPISNVSAGDKTSVNKRNTNTTLTASITGGFDSKKMIHDSSPDSKIDGVRISTASASIIYLKNIFTYRAGIWRIDSIKDYRDNYQEIKAVKVRGERVSRRRAYG
tara:strand:- start:24 stop:1211 length:1188 start_codon:yes stop_codon:yes gene_type:complete